MTTESKPYLVLARKYRPQAFGEVIGQEPVSTTLRNAIKLKRVGHAYLFAGPRGVGKTSMARIFAKALNCEKGPTETPCGACRACKDIETGRSLDVLEIDGASNRGIEEIRVLCENVRFAPAASRFKIYIVDEVHQVTDAAFNALLKTLEEPPAHVKFVFATTSANKVPATILSRCQRFDFRRIPTAAIAAALKEIAKKEKIKIDDEALFAVAKAADGSLRDGQSILDQIAVVSGGAIGREEVLHSLGEIGEERLIGVTDALAKRDAAGALKLFDSVMGEGKDPAIFMEKLIEHVRNLTFLQISEKLSEMIDASDSYRREISRQKSLLSRQELFYFFSVLSHALHTARRFEARRIPLEMALVKLALREPMEALSELLARVPAAEKKTAKAAAKPEKPALEAAAPIRISRARPARDEDDAPDAEEMPEEVTRRVPASTASEAAAAVSLVSVWPTLLADLKREKMSLGTYLSEAEPLEIEQGIARVLFPEHLNFHRETLEVPENKKLIETLLERLAGSPVQIRFEIVKEVKPGPGAAAASPQSEGTIRSALNILGGRRVD